MGITDKTIIADQRREIAARREADYERYERSMKERGAPEFVAAGELVDEFDVEAEALYLIEAHPKKEIVKPLQEYEDNARTALFEALTASGHLSRIELSGNAEEVNQQVLTRLLNSFTDHLPPHEQKRRIKEVEEELKIQRVQEKIFSGELPADTEIMTVSDYPEDMVDNRAISIGYRPYNRKGMVRSTSFQRNEDGTVTRVIEQISRSNADARQTAYFLEGHGVELDYSNEMDVNVLGVQLITDRSNYIDGVVDLQRRLDSFNGSNLRYGEAISLASPAYEELREVSADREAQLGEFAAELAELEASLDGLVVEGKVSRRRASEQYFERVKEILRTICTRDPRYAKDTFGEEAVAGYEKAADLLASGDAVGAADAVADNAGNEQAVTFCGAGDAPNSQMSADQLARLRQRFDGTAKKESWRWTNGVCRVDECPSRPKRTKIGPCSVCVGCQSLFDKNKNPRTEYRKKINGAFWNIVQETQEEFKQKRVVEKAEEEQRKAEKERRQAEQTAKAKKLGKQSLSLTQVVAQPKNSPGRSAPALAR